VFIIMFSRKLPIKIISLVLGEGIVLWWAGIPTFRRKWLSPFLLFHLEDWESQVLRNNTRPAHKTRRYHYRMETRLALNYPWNIEQYFTRNVPWSEELCELLLFTRKVREVRSEMSYCSLPGMASEAREECSM
jgi:hypothetical protein